MTRKESISIRIKPSVRKKLDAIVDHLNIDTSMWGENKHTTELGYYLKKVTRADVIEIAIQKCFDEILPGK